MTNSSNNNGNGTTGFDKMVYELGKSQAQQCLPLVFIQNPDIKNLQSEDRLTSLKLTEPVKQGLQAMLKASKLPTSERCMVDLLLSNFECLVTINNGDIDLNKVDAILDTIKTRGELTNQDAQYLEYLNKIAVQTQYMTLNEGICAKYHDKLKPDEELPTRISNMIKRVQPDLFRDWELVEGNRNEIRACKIDLNKGKITTMQKQREYLSVVPLYQAIGYVEGLSDLLKSGLYQVEYFRSDFKTREQYISRNSNVVSDIYDGQQDIINMISHYEPDPIETMTGVVGDYDATTGFLRIADLGLPVLNVQQYGIKEILRKVTITNLLSIRKIADEEYPRLVAEMNSLIGYDLEQVENIFEMNIEDKSLPELRKIKDIVASADGVLNVDSNTGVDKVDLLNSVKLTITSYTTTGQRNVLKMMLQHPDLFRVPTRADLTNVHVVEQPNVEKFEGNLSDFLNFS